jgi:far upstream element-binding protein
MQIVTAPFAANPAGGAVTKEFLVPHAMAGLVIGRGGENLKRIEQQTQTRVQFSQDPPDAQGMRRVTAVGTAEGVERAHQMIQALMEDPQLGRMSGDITPSPNQRTEMLLVPNERVGLLIGRGGETVREIQRRCNVRVNITPDDHAGGQMERPVQIIGDEHGVQSARAMIQEIIEGTSSLVSRWLSDTEYIDTHIHSIMIASRQYGHSLSQCNAKYQCYDDRSRCYSH